MKLLQADGRWQAGFGIASTCGLARSLHCSRARAAGSPPHQSVRNGKTPTGCVSTGFAACVRSI